MSIQPFLKEQNSVQTLEKKLKLEFVILKRVKCFCLSYVLEGIFKIAVLF